MFLDSIYYNELFFICFICECIKEKKYLVSSMYVRFNVKIMNFSKYQKCLTLNVNDLYKDRNLLNS